MLYRNRAILTTLLLWHAIAGVILCLFPKQIGHLFLTLYTRFVMPDIDADYGLYERMSYGFGFMVATMPATLLAIPFFDWINGSRPRFRIRLGAFLVWEALVVSLLYMAYETGLNSMYNNWDWALFGPPENIYSFRNIMLPRILAILTVTLPIGGIILMNYASVTREAR